MTAAIVAIVACSLTFLAMVVTITRYITKVESLVHEIKKDRPMVKSIPVLTYRVGFIEKHLNISTPIIPTFASGNGSGQDD